MSWSVSSREPTARDGKTRRSLVELRALEPRLDRVQDKKSRKRRAVRRRCVTRMTAQHEDRLRYRALGGASTHLSLFIILLPSNQYFT